MSRHKLGEGIDYRDNRLLEVFILHAGGPHSARAPAMLRPAVEECGSILSIELSDDVKEDGYYRRVVEVKSSS